MRFLLSIKTVFPKPGGKVWYDDQREVHRQIFEGDETIDYAFMGQDPDAANCGGILMAHILLTGAGFSRNWGGWLANEAFEYLPGAPEIGEHLRYELWQTKTRGGFEDTLAGIQIAYQTNRSPENERRLLISTQVCRHSGSVFEGGLVEKGSDFFGIALQGEH